MTPADLAAIGQALYGRAWQSPLARDLGVSARTMRRWVASGPPDGTAEGLRGLLRQRRATIDSLIYKTGGFP